MPTALLVLLILLAGFWRNKRRSAALAPAAA